MLSKAKKVHMIGIGGYGMSALAKVLLEQGFSVSGSDITPSEITRNLTEMGAEISYGHSRSNGADCDLAVYSTAISPENDELVAVRERVPVLHRSELLAEFINSRTGLAITGAHGKTTTTTMVALILEKAGLDPTAFVGGEVVDFSGTARMGKGEYVVAEADESDSSFSRYRPWAALVTNIEADHLEHYDDDFAKLLAGYATFLGNVAQEGFVVVPEVDAHIKDVLSAAHCRVVTFGLAAGDYHALSPRLVGRESIFTLVKGGTPLGEVALKVPGIHNIANAVAAAALALELGVDFLAVQEAMVCFKGAKRRFQILFEGDWQVVDDYAHHPTEVVSTLSAAKTVAQGRVIAVFQPHRFTRTRYFFKEFSESFAQADIVLIDKIYAASETPIPGIDSQTLAQMSAEQHQGHVKYIAGQEALTDYLKVIIQPGDLVITMGAGNIWKVSHGLAKYSKELMEGN